MKRVVIFGDGIPTANPLDEIVNEVFKNHGITLDTEKHELHIKPTPGPFAIRSVLSNRKKNAFSVVWMDGTTTVVHCQSGDDWDDEKALAMCFTKKALGNKGNFNDKFNDALDNKMKVIPAPEKHECKCDTPCKNCTCGVTNATGGSIGGFNIEKNPVEKAEASVSATLSKMKESAQKANVAMKKMIDEFAGEPVKVKRYDLFLMDPCGDKTEIYRQGTDEEIHRAMRVYRMKHYPILEANRTPYRVWMLNENLMVDFGAGSYFMVPGMDHDTFVKGK
jgi:hypothetical protein